jgi:hypothetical protein
VPKNATNTIDANSRHYVAPNALTLDGLFDDSVKPGALANEKTAKSTALGGAKNKRDEQEAARKPQSYQVKLTGLKLDVDEVTILMTLRDSLRCVFLLTYLSIFFLLCCC